MSFFSEVKKDVGITDMQLMSGFSFVNFCGETMYVEGVKKLLKITDECVSLLTKIAEIEVLGELKVGAITECSVVISGRIDSVTTRRLK